DPRRQSTPHHDRSDSRQGAARLRPARAQCRARRYGSRDSDPLVEETILQRECHGAVVAAGADRRTFRPAELCRPAAAQRHRQRQADARVPLLVVVLDAVDGGAPADVIAVVARNPESGTEAVAGVELEHGDRLLAAALAAAEG